MRIVNNDSIPGIERYRITAQAIGLVELLGNARPSRKQLKVAEKIVGKLRLSWQACESVTVLMRVLSMEKSTKNNEI